MTKNGKLVPLPVALFLRLIGMFVETISTLIFVAPILPRIAATHDVDPIHCAIVTVITVRPGAPMPPVAILLLPTCRIADVSHAKTMRPLAPFFLVRLGRRALILYVPTLTTTLPNAF